MIGIAIAAVLGLMLAGGGGRSSSGGKRGVEAARDKLRASDGEVMRPGFVPPDANRLAPPDRSAGFEIVELDDAAAELEAAELEAAELEAAGLDAPEAEPEPEPEHQAPPDPRAARRLAGPLYRALRRAEPAPVVREDVARFQAAAGLAASGLYDDATHHALRRYGIRRPPAPWFLDGGAA